MNRSTLEVLGFVVMILIGIGAVLFPALGLALAMLGGMGPFLQDPGVLASALTYAALSALLGIFVGVQGILGLLRRASQPFRIGGRWFWLAAFVGIVVVVALGGLFVPPVRSVARVLAAVVPGIAVLSFITHRLARERAPATWRQAAAETGMGIALSLPWAMFWEIALLFAAVFGARLVLGMAPSSSEWLQQLSERLQQGARTTEDLAGQPVLLGAVLLFVAGLIPLIEETGKALAVGLLAVAHRPSLAQAVTWGVVGGVVFGVVESSLASPLLGGGALVALIRFGTLLMHAATAALSARGIYEWATRRRARRFFLAITLSIGLHAVWNALAIGQAGIESLNRATVLAGASIVGAMFFVLSLGAVALLILVMEP